jgi:hypothetical protein
MDIQPKAQQPISDDQELAKVLAGVNQQAEEAAGVAEPEETPAPVVQEDPVVEPAAPVVMPDPIMSAPAAGQNSDLDTIKQEALGELRPLVDKLDVSPEEKFDTYLLLLRSTDDKALIAPAHEAARGIADEARRAQALLDIIKEIDYLSGAAQQQAV